MRARFLQIVGALLLALLLPASAASADTVDRISGELMCQCGCTMVVNVCDCGMADDFRGLIREKLAEGQTSKQIIDYFVAQYGEKVLASPTKEGFNLTAYILPFAAIFAGGGGVSVAAWAWVRRGRQANLALPAAIDTVDLRIYEQDLERELAEFDRDEDEEEEDE